LSDFAGKAFLCTAIPSVELKHALGVKGSFWNPSMANKLSEDVILLSWEALK
jgi:hypothetical protein